MSLPHWVALIALGAGGWGLAVAVNRRRLRAYDGSGDAGAGIVVFVEPVRWLFVIWGFAWFGRGLRRAGCRHQIRLFRWCSTAGALLVIPDLVRRRRLMRSGERLARLVERLAGEHPGRPIHLAGYSSGCFVVLEACRQARSGTVTGEVILLAGAVSSTYGWDGLRERLRGVHSFHSKLDWISGLGPLLFGSNDRRWGPGCGAVGFRRPPWFVAQRGWRPADVRLGYFGDHFTITAPRFVADHVAPLLTSGRRNEVKRNPAERRDADVGAAYDDHWRWYRPEPLHDALPALRIHRRFPTRTTLSGMWGGV